MKSKNFNQSEFDLIKSVCNYYDINIVLIQPDCIVCDLCNMKFIVDNLISKFSDTKIKVVINANDLLLSFQK